MDSTLFRAILSMDAYNRGYRPGIKDLDSSPIGNATFLTDSTITSSTSGVGQAAGFYAAAYTLANGSKIISYRGTDQNAPNWWARTGMGSDLWSGYGTAVGRV